MPRLVMADVLERLHMRQVFASAHTVARFVTTLYNLVVVKTQKAEEARLGLP